METMEMDAESFMEKFNSVTAALRVESGDTVDSHVTCHIRMNLLYFPKLTSNTTSKG